MFVQKRPFICIENKSFPIMYVTSELMLFIMCRFPLSKKKNGNLLKKCLYKNEPICIENRSFSMMYVTSELIILYPELSFLLRLHNICQRSFYKIFVKFRNIKKRVLKIVLINVNINKDENKSLISNQFSLKNDLWSFLTF